MNGSKTLIENLAEFTANLHFEDLPPQVVSKAGDAFFDLIGCFYGALKFDEPKIFLRRAAAVNPGRDVTLWGTGMKAAAAEAALAEGSVSYYLEFDDGVSLGGHWGSSAIPAAAAMLEQKEGTGRDMVLSIVCAYEAGTRISRLYAARMLNNKIHFPCAMGAFAAAAGTAKALGLSAEQIARGLSNCCLAPVGPYSAAISGAPVKSFYSGWPNFMGITMMDLAARGIYGDTDTFESENGLGVVWGGAALGEEQKRKALASLGREFKLMESYFKPYPCCRWLHAPLELAKRIIQRNKGKTTGSITVSGPKFLNLYDTKGDFTQKVKAQYSIPFSLSALIIAGKAGVEEFEAPFRTAPGVSAIADTVTVETDPDLEAAFPGSFSVKLRIRFSDNTEDQESGGLPWGHSAPASQEELIRKFTMLVQETLPEQEICRWLDIYQRGFHHDDAFAEALHLLRINHLT